ncbi:MAG: hypothetical protein JJE22_03955 [Bacteroidia bacterium]|nr:hypothetical protein [Bacteroidia bacterium]
MIALDDTIAITPERVITKKPRLQSSGISFPVYKGIKETFEIKNSLPEPEDFPMKKWLMPSQPENYLKHPKHDLF